MSDTPKFVQLAVMKKGLLGSELVGLTKNGKVYHWQKLPGWNCWVWRELNNDDANRPVFAGDQ